MKILLVNKFHYLKGGSETYYFALGKMLSNAGHKVIYFSMRDDNNIPCEQDKYFVDNVDYNSKMNPVQIARSSAKLLYSFEAKKKFRKLIEDERPDIIHLNIFQSQLTGSIVDVAAKYHIPMVYTAHDLKTVCPSYLMMNHGKICDACINGNYWTCIKTSCMKDSKAKSILAAMEAEIYRLKKTYSKIDLIICPSKHHKRRLMQGRITKNPIIYIPNFLPEGTVFEKGPNKGDYFLFFGRLSIEKGIMTLVKAFEIAKTEKPLYIVGTGPQESEILLILLWKRRPADGLLLFLIMAVCQSWLKTVKQVLSLRQETVTNWRRRYSWRTRLRSIRTTLSAWRRKSTQAAVI